MCHIWHIFKITWPAAWVGRYMCVCRFVAICYHDLITQSIAPESFGGRQHSVSLLVSGSVFRGPTCCLHPSFFDACLLRFPSDRHPKTLAHTRLVLSDTLTPANPSLTLKQCRSDLCGPYYTHQAHIMFDKVGLSLKTK